MKQLSDDFYNDIEFKYFCQDKLLENIRQISRYPDRWNFRCPICGDSKKKQVKRGWYYVKNNSYHCWNGGCPCSESGLPILKVLSLLTDKSVSDLKFEYLKSLDKPRKERKIEEIKPLPKAKVELLDTWIPIDEKVQKYIDYRRVLTAPFAPKKWEFYFDKRKKRLVIPWYVDGKMKSYQLRAIMKGQEPKYLFPFNVEKPVFGLDRIDETFPFVFMLEGAFDSVWVQNGVAIGGVTPTNDQLTRIASTLCEPVYFLDNQWQDETSMEKSLRLAHKNPTAKIFIWPKAFTQKDVNEYVIKNNSNPFADKKFLESCISCGVKALLELKS